MQRGAAEEKAIIRTGLLVILSFPSFPPKFFAQWPGPEIDQHPSPHKKPTNHGFPAPPKDLFSNGDPPHTQRERTFAQSLQKNRKKNPHALFP